MTRTEIEANYKIRDGIIVSPGKFEGEPVYAPYFWDMVLDGGADETECGGDTPIDIFHISAEDRKQFPEIGSETTTICIWPDGNGFVRTQES